MGLLDSITGMASQALSSGQGNHPLLQGVLGLLQNHEGGVAGLVQQFKDKGLGEVAASWVGTGENLPISAEQLKGVLGNETLGQMAAQLGVSGDQLSSQLSGLLPQVIDKLTPNGEVAGGGFDATQALGMLQGLLKK
jgi:uncharacterized protein YidB (DUF937 family)